MEITGQPNLAAAEHLRQHRHSHGQDRKSKIQRKAGRGLRKYLGVLNATLFVYAGYTAFFLFMQRYCTDQGRCFLDTGINQLLLIIAAFAFTAHVAITAAVFIKHRRTKSRRIQMHQIIALVSCIVALMLLLFKGVHALSQLANQTAV